MLEAKAVLEEKRRLQAAAAAYNRAIGLAGTQETILLVDKEGKEFRIYTGRMFEAITDALLKKRDKRLKSEAVTKFLEQVEGFQSNIESLAEYCANQ